ncbi:hypothetical protein B0H65DRAFT_587719 [Neurospora tetraspora]|uniref:Uncharacterized protein n=1 Tax=Neurospora tetraspora TaxID=94610 RepID=A0AAE0MU42_9PEZI|nr:hypothetical protein B0H65DRAFT_587719 [Neurospora tetraspora]
MNPDAFPAPVAALDHPVMDKMMQELAAMRYPDRHTPTPPTYTSVVTTIRYNDEYHRNCVTPAQRAAAAKIQEWYLEGSQDVMMRFYNLGLSRVFTAAHLYALDFSLWMRGYALPRGDFGNDRFYYTKPSAHVGPFSSEYDNFFAERFRERHMASRMVTPRDMSPQSAPGRSQHVTITSTNIDPLVREETERANLEIPAIQAPPTSTARPRRDSNKPSLDAGLPSAEINQPLKQEAKPAPPANSATEAHLTSTTKPSSGSNKPNITSGDIDQQLRRETKPAPTATSATEAHSTSTAKASRGSNKRSLDAADTMALAPQPKRAQPGLPLRTLTSMGLLGRHEAKFKTLRQ